MFSFKGVKSRMFPAKKQVFKNGQLETDYFDRKYRGNFIKYAYRASDIMQAPEIRRQIRRHYTILKNSMDKFGFDHVKDK